MEDKSPRLASNSALPQEPSKDLDRHSFTARREIEGLVAALELPTRLPGVEHIQSRRSWHDRVVDYYRQLATADHASG